jgi:CDP-diacylglycerol pyrophosphatase
MGTNPRRTLVLLSTLLLLITTLTTSGCATGNRDILWNIVSDCLDPTVPGYDKLCRWPVETSAAACRKTTDVWTMNSEFVILRDVKMCACPADKTFVHGLAIPRARVTGSEDPNRPDGIWQYAWDNAVGRIGNEGDIALVVNPPGIGNRGQDQLHVHLVRLNDAGRRVVGAAGAPGVQKLADVWRKADQLATEKGLKYYGVLVARNPAGGFAVHVDDRNREYDYTVARCPASATHGLPAASPQPAGR